MKYEFLLKEKGDKKKVGSSFSSSIAVPKERKEEIKVKAFGHL